MEGRLLSFRNRNSINGLPRLGDVVRAIARLGGFIDRPTNDPGTQTLWVGMQRTHDLSNAWNTFGPGAKKISVGYDVRYDEPTKHGREG